ncbi:helix-turn-helix domain-containing protein [Xanthobacter tagetidis]|uniref:XRE family transcriptional regulator n=1 Tax=Xanthobacter tagetidis TaxID=60216 RepID=A0A3L7AHW9_9HYPH|nr:helix-turn-helix transcriptional regulator [Xanthobacter tagetidis]RLP79644.1 XRE family transcriptional regulator [Xanthobacter tagetidis]
MDMRALVGRNFARLRREKGLTQEQIEERSGHSQQYLSDLERGRRNPTVVTLYELAQALGCNPADLIKEPPDSRG